ncbi:hypothetical protein M8J76_000765 [Diaphorina citri]|nr:hypothetical protein M8J75_010402 [Diaphorina citri]KAI5748636.1 hypothetical protein M8J76_000765 [Diaphorina citri]
MIDNMFLRVINVAIHVIGAVIFPFGIYSHYKVQIPAEVLPIDSAYGQKFKYLTFINEIVQSLYFIVCVVCDIVSLMPTSSPMSILNSTRNYFFTSIGFPIGSFVTITFWGLFLVNRDLVMPADFDQYFPKWLNHLVHTMVIVFPLIEMATSYRKYWPAQTGLIGLLVFQVVYLIWIHIVYYKSDLWVYPILEKLGLIARYAFLGSSVLFTIVLYFLGQYLNNAIWSSQESGKKQN